MLAILLIFIYFCKCIFFLSSNALENKTIKISFIIKMHVHLMTNLITELSTIPEYGGLDNSVQNPDFIIVYGFGLFKVLKSLKFFYLFSY
jgi:hypothetical protein